MYTQAKPTSRFWTRRKTIAAIALGALAVAALAAVVLVNRLAPTGVRAEITACEFRGGGEIQPTAVADYEVTNVTRGPLPATLEIEYRDPDGKVVATSTVEVPSLAPGATTRGQKVQWLPAAMLTGGSCVISKVT